MAQNHPGNWCSPRWPGICAGICADAYDSRHRNLDAFCFLELSSTHFKAVAEGRGRNIKKRITVRVESEHHGDSRFNALRKQCTRADRRTTPSISLKLERCLSHQDQAEGETLEKMKKASNLPEPPRACLSPNCLLNSDSRKREKLGRTPSSVTRRPRVGVGLAVTLRHARHSSGFWRKFPACSPGPCAGICGGQRRHFQREGGGAARGWLSMCRC